MSEQASITVEIGNILNRYGITDTLAGADMMAAVAEIAALPRMGMGGNSPPDPIDPENLVNVEELSALYAEQYPALVTRAQALAAACDRWAAGHSDGNGFKIADDADSQKTGDFIVKQLRPFAGKTGEVQAVRAKVVRQFLDGQKVTNAFFNGLCDQIASRIVSMDSAEANYQNEKQRRERLAREAEAREQQRKAAEAIEAARALAASNEGDAEAIQEVVGAALAAEEKAEKAEIAAAAPVHDLVRSTSAMGVTTSQRITWAFELTSIVDLCAAIAKGDPRAPANFVAPNDSIINASIRGEKGMRDVPGLRIFNKASVIRRG